MKFTTNSRPFLVVFWILLVAVVSFAKKETYFERVSTFLACQQLEANCNTDDEASAETVWYFTRDGKTNLVYTDAEQEAVGFVDITDPNNPIADQLVNVDGEPTTVRVIGDYAVVGVNTSPDFVNPSGNLKVINLSDKTVAGDIDLSGQPDAVAVSKDQKFIAVAIENERDEDLNDGELPQLPPGYLDIIKVLDVADYNTWELRRVFLTGNPIDDCTDPEPEYVAINSDSTKVAVTLQENNAVFSVDLASGDLDSVYDWGTVDLENVDIEEEDVVSQTGSIPGVKREPDGITWIGDTTYVATANEGDYVGGSRNEPENLLYAEADGNKFLFVASERSNLVFVYDVSDPSAPILKQTLPVGVAPEGLAFVPEQNLLAVASEKDDRDEGYRSSISLFKLAKADGPEYPTVVSSFRDATAGTSIPFAALSGLGASATDKDCLFAVDDETYKKSRVFKIDTSSFPYELVQEDRIMDTNGVLSNCLGSSSTFTMDIDKIIEDDMTVNINSEDITNVEDEEDGFSGIAHEGDNLVITFQKAWSGDLNPRIAVYNTVSETWKYAFYPLEAPASQNGESEVELSDIASIGNGKFLVTEVDDQASLDAGVKMICIIDLGDFSFTDGTLLDKTLYLNLIDNPLTETAPFLIGVGGLAVLDGHVWVNNNVDSKEHRLKKVGKAPKVGKKGKAPKTPKTPKAPKA